MDMDAEEARLVSSGFPAFDNVLYNNLQLCIKERAHKHYSKCVYDFSKSAYTQEQVQEAIDRLLSKGFSIKTEYHGASINMVVSW